MSEVDSWPSTLMRSNERLTVTPSSRSHSSADSFASVWMNTSRVAKFGEIMPAPLPWMLRRTLPVDSATSSVTRFSNASVVQIAVAKSRSPSARSSCAAASVPRVIASIGSGTPMTPVEATATTRSLTPQAIAAPPCIFAASSIPRPPVAAFALPELTTTARRPPRSVCCLVSRTGADSAPERAEARGARGLQLVADDQAEVPGAGALDPAGDARRAEAQRQAALRHLGGVRGRLDPARVEEAHAALPFMRSPPARRVRTSG